MYTIVYVGQFEHLTPFFASTFVLTNSALFWRKNIKVPIINFNVILIKDPY